MTQSTTQRLISRDIRARQELRRGTVLTDVRVVDFDTSGLTSTVFVVDVDIGANRVIQNVVVKSSTGQGAREFAQQGKAVEIQRNAGGRWIVIGPSDRIRGTGQVQLLDESTDTATASTDEGFGFGRRVFTYYADNGAWGVAGFGNSVALDASGNEVIL